MRRAGQRRLLRLKQRRDEKWRALQLHRPCFAVFVPPADGDLSVVQHRLETRIQTKVAVVILDNVGLAVDRAEPGARFQPDVPSRAGKRAGQPRHQRHRRVDRKSTRLNSSHSQISYAVFCLKKKKKTVAAASLLMSLPAYGGTCKKSHPHSTSTTSTNTTPTQAYCCHTATTSDANSSLRRTL